MIPNAEALLVALLLAFYLKDSLLLLAPDEAVLVRGLRGRWRAGFGSRHYALRGRQPLLCHPLLPFEPVLRLRWAMNEPGGGAGTGTVDATSSLPRSLATLGPLVASVAALLFGALPAILLGHLGTVPLLGALGALYALVMASLVLAWRDRASYALDARAFGVLAVEMLLCPPLAANLVRRLSWRLAPREDFLHAAARVLPAAPLAAARRACAARIDDELDVLESGTPLASALRAAAARLRSLAEETPA